MCNLVVLWNATQTRKIEMYSVVSLYVNNLVWFQLTFLLKIIYNAKFLKVYGFSLSPLDSNNFYFKFAIHKILVIFVISLSFQLEYYTINKIANRSPSVLCKFVADFCPKTPIRDFWEHCFSYKHYNTQFIYY